MTIRKDFRSYVASDPPPVVKGTVVEVKVSSIILKTTKGKVEFQVPNPTFYSLNDEVAYQGNRIVGKLPSSQNTTVIAV